MFRLSWRGRERSRKIERTHTWKERQSAAQKDRKAEMVQERGWQRYGKLLRHVRTKAEIEGKEQRDEKRAERKRKLKG